jgi:hypothetical protein
MDKSLENSWRQYVEIPQRVSEPVKLDKILAERMKAFLKARKVKPFSDDQQRPDIDIL